ncbi:hypothetical protein LTR40_011521, partial [Exophiala xenobiotica]
GFNYPNANHYTDYLVKYIFEHTRRTNEHSWPRPGDRPWNNPGPRRGKSEANRSHLPTLKAIVLDMSSVNNVDVTSVQNLIDVRNQLDRYASPDSVQWHFACVNNRWTKRALASAGFGYPSAPQEEYHRWKPIFSVAEIGGSASAAAQAEAESNRRLSRVHTDEENGHIRSHSRTSSGHGVTRTDAIEKVHHYKDDPSTDSGSRDSPDLSREITNSKAYNRVSSRKMAVVQGLNRPFFHIDLTSAVQSAIATVEHQNQLRAAEQPVDEDRKDGA